MHRQAIVFSIVGMREGRFELPPLSGLDPKSSAASSQGPIQPKVAPTRPGWGAHRGADRFDQFFAPSPHAWY